jgi:anaerobic selenocysteine-containing dehydrogenase
MSRTVHGACPLDCPDACAWEVVLDDRGEPVRLRGRADHPFTAGGLCPKVNPWLRHARDDSRLTQPLRRVGPKGDGHFVPVSWDDALGEMATRFQAIIERHGGAAIWPFFGTGNLGWVQGANGPGRVWTRMGASGHNMSICSVAGNEGMAHTVGQGDWMDATEFAHSGLVVVWGSNTLVSNRHLWPFIERARADNDAPMVVIDPIRTRTAEHADLHLAPRPGTDALLALGVSAELVRRNAEDRSFLEERTLGWPEFETMLQGITLEETVERTGIDGADVRRFVDLLAERSPLGLRVGHGMQRHAAGGQAMRAVACLPAVLGAYDQQGGGSLYSGAGRHKNYNLERSRRPELGDRARTLVHTNLGRNLLELDDPPVDALVVWGANPMVSNPQTELVRRGLARSDLLTVVIDAYPTETTAWADLVLPSTLQHEQTELNDSYNHRHIALNQPAARPPGACLPHTEIFRRLAAAMGYDDAELFASDDALIDDLLDTDDLRAAGIDRVALEQAGHLPLPARHRPAERLFRTPSGRFEFASRAAEAAGHGLLPRPDLAHEAPHPPDGHLALLAPASEHHVNSTFAATSHTLRRADEPPLFLHPDDAASRRLQDGQRVRVVNDRGHFTATLRITTATRPGVAATTKGRWGHPINATTVERDADMGGGAVFHDNAVRVEAVVEST